MLVVAVFLAGHRFFDDDMGTSNLQATGSLDHAILMHDVTPDVGHWLAGSMQGAFKTSAAGSYLTYNG
jgi:hypothetical protein